MFRYLSILTFFIVIWGGNPSESQPADLDVWVLAGQSNMYPGLPIGGFQNQAKLLGEADPRISLWTKEGEWAEAVPGQVGPGFTFAKQIVDEIDRPIGLIFCAVGNTSISEWVPTAEGKEGNPSHYRAMMDQIDASGGRVKGVLWYQGENDGSLLMESSVYEKSLLEIVDSIRAETDQPDLPVFAVQIARFYVRGAVYDSAWEGVRDAQRRASLQRDNFYLVSALDVPMSDMAHVTADGQVRWAKRLAEAALSEVYEKPGHGKPIQLESIRVVDRETTTPSIHLHFSGVTGQLKAEGRPADFEVRVENPTALTPSFYRTDFDPEDPAGLILRVANPLTQPASLVYGAGARPYCNIVDEKDMAIPAFGPIELPPKK